MAPNSTSASVGETGMEREYIRPFSLRAVAKIILFSFLSLGRDRCLCGLLLFTLAPGISRAQSKPEEVVFPSGGLELHGFLWKPEGTGPFPAIVWNHGSEKLPGSQPALAKFYTEHSYVFFVPHRRGQGRSPGDYIQDLARGFGVVNSNALTGFYGPVVKLVLDEPLYGLPAMSVTVPNPKFTTTS